MFNVYRKYSQCGRQKKGNGTHVIIKKAVSYYADENTTYGIFLKIKIDNREAILKSREKLHLQMKIR